MDIKSGKFFCFYSFNSDSVFRILLLHFDMGFWLSLFGIFSLIFSGWSFCVFWLLSILHRVMAFGCVWMCACVYVCEGTPLLGIPCCHNRIILLWWGIYVCIYMRSFIRDTEKWQKISKKIFYLITPQQNCQLLRILLYSESVFLWLNDNAKDLCDTTIWKDIIFKYLWL